jgi:hypothetical protein
MPASAYRMERRSASGLSPIIATEWFSSIDPSAVAHFLAGILVAVRDLP